MSAGVELFNIVIVHSRQVIHTEHPEAISLMNQTYFIARRVGQNPACLGAHGLVETHPWSYTLKYVELRLVVACPGISMGEHRPIRV